MTSDRLKRLQQRICIKELELKALKLKAQALEIQEMNAEIKLRATTPKLRVVPTKSRTVSPGCKTCDRIINLIASAPGGLNPEQVAAQLAVSQSYARRTLVHLWRQGRLNRQFYGGCGGYVYRLLKQPNESPQDELRLHPREEAT